MVSGRLCSPLGWPIGCSPQWSSGECVGHTTISKPALIAGKFPKLASAEFEGWFRHISLFLLYLATVIRNLLVGARYPHAFRHFWCLLLSPSISSYVRLPTEPLIKMFCSLSIPIFWTRHTTLTSSSWPESSHQTWRYIADCTGIVAIANYALLWAFAGRNNVFLWLTGWNYGTFNVFHRWIARVATVEVIVHSVAFTVIILMGRPRAFENLCFDLLNGYGRWWQGWPCWSQ